MEKNACVSIFAGFFLFRSHFSGALCTFVFFLEALDAAAFVAALANWRGWVCVLYWKLWPE